ncbi:light-regulated protein, chloroplastic [Silene latifolia]|uniref:light-regulated protein, chloroplastic n=1 Tax=Silene latifolia TaxID=37657 RepID=UPI003D788ABF
MQTASTCIVQPFFPSKNGVIRVNSPHKQPFFTTTHASPLKAVSGSFEPLSVNYNSPTSVFPAEACETVGGDACSANMYPEVKLSKSEEKGNKKVTIEQVDRDYFDYNSQSKSVLMGEACDDLGGQFCEAPYKSGVYH